MYLVVHRRTFLWGVLVAACCLLLPFLGGVAAKTAAAARQNTGESTAVSSSVDEAVSDFSEI